MQHRIEATCNVRCAAVSSQLGEDPIGTATVNERYIMLELPLPWSKPFLETRHFPQDVKKRIQTLQADGLQFRLLVFHSDANPSPKGMRRLFCFTKPEGMFAEFDKQEYVVPDALVPDFISQLAQGKKPASQYSSYEVKSSGIRELFVCTHGRHDVCCGKLGAPIYESLQANVVPRMEGRLRAWRICHIGGHRMAPTLIDFPTGRYWGKIEMQHLDALASSDQLMPQLDQQYRGWSGVGLLEQVLEREIWKQFGANWPQYLKSGEVLQEMENGAEVRIEYRSPDGNESGAYTAFVKKTGELLMSGCGIEPFMKAQYKVEQLRHIPAVLK